MSLLVDILIVLVLIGCLVHGFRRGLLGSLGSVAGLVAGAAAAAFLAPRAGALVPDAAWRPAAVVGTALLLVLVGTAVGARVGSAVARPVRRSALRPVDKALGAGVQVVVGALAVSVLASLAVSSGPEPIAAPVAHSAVVHGIEALTPGPVDQVLAGIRSAVASPAAITAERGPAAR